MEKSRARMLKAMDGEKLDKEVSSSSLLTTEGFREKVGKRFLSIGHLNINR